jgi:hypothetical protein
MRVSLHAEAWCLDGPVGHAVAAVLSSDASTVTDLVLRLHAPAEEERLAPMLHVVEAGPRHLRLDLTGAEVSRLQPLRGERLALLPPPRPVAMGGLIQGSAELWDDIGPPAPRVVPAAGAVPAGERLLRWHARVHTADGTVAHLEELDIDDAQRLRAFVVRTGRFRRDRARVPLVALRSLADDDVELRLNTRQLRALSGLPGMHA